MTPRILPLFAFLLLFACNESDPFADCRYSRPEPIFKTASPKILDHNFIVKKLSGIENVTFENGISLVLIQSGCDAIKQEFEFRLPGDFYGQETSFWIDKTIEQFSYFSRLDPSFIAFNAWTQAIVAIRDNLQLGQFAELQPGYFIKIDKVLSKDYAILMVTLSEQP